MTSGGVRALRPLGRQEGLLHADRVHGVAVDQQHAAGEVLTGQPERVCVVPLLRPVVVHQGERHPVRGLQVRGPFADHVRPVPDHDHHVAQPHRGEVAQRDVEDGGPPGHRQQRLRQHVRVGAQPPPGTGGQHHADHRRSPSLISGSLAASQPDRLTLHKSHPRYAVSAR